MKILLYADPHWCQYSSVVRMRGTNYSLRLENLINSLNWVNQIAKEDKVDKIVCLGDFFDRDDLNAEEISALSEVDLSQHHFLLGNHEMYTNEYCSNKLFNNYINKPTYDKESNLLYLPYSKTANKETISALKQELNIDSKVIVLSHNDIAGIQYGGFTSIEGYSLNDIEQNCKIFINGHLHNQQLLLNEPNCKVLNLGNLTGQNFSEDASKYSHSIAILNTDDCSIDLIDNPYSFNFFKEKIENEIELNKLKHKVESSPNSIVSLTVIEDEELIKKANDLNVLFKRVLVEHNYISKEQKTESALSKIKELDHSTKFKDFVMSKFDGELNATLLMDELTRL